MQAMKVFQPFRLDTVNHCLWRAEERVRLTPRAFDVLRYLVEHAERLVTQDEILEAIWPETYVNPEVIKQYIRGILKALGDDPEKPSYIRLLRNEGGKETRAMFRVPEHRFFVLGRQIHVIVGGSRIRWPAGLHAACVRRECSACVSNCRRLRPS